MYKIKALIVPVLASAACLTLLSSCASNTVSKNAAPPSDADRIADLQIVDCLLPGKVRQLGSTQYLMARQPIKTTASDCRIRGGEYTSYDRASLASSLKVWMPAAEAGDVDAMANVGEIFERGLADSPNYEAAALWYEKAAKAGNSRAQFNLGTLYEQGLGVAKDKQRAMNWYRQAWGMQEDDLVFKSIADTELRVARQEMEEEMRVRNSRIERLQKELAGLRQSVNEAQGQARNDASERLALKKEVDDLQEWIASLEKERRTAREQLAAAPQLRAPEETSDVEPAAPTTPALKESDYNFGRYFALVIGNQDYTKIDPLETPLNDARSIADVLERKYGFSVQLLLNASNVEAMEAINDLYSQVGKNDNLLIYYAGHGARIPSGEIENGYWLPVNADAPPRDTFWISNEFVTSHLSRIPAKRVLVMADSCYAGLLSNSPGYLIVKDSPRYTDEFMRYKLPKRSRLLLASGGDRPVLDEGVPGHSVFASVLLETLENNDNILSGPQLYTSIDSRIRKRASMAGFSQRAEYKVIKGAGHEVGDFFFVPAGS